MQSFAHDYSTNIYGTASRDSYDINPKTNYNIAHMQQEDFIRAQSAQAQADQGLAHQQDPSMQNAYMQDPNSQHQYMQNPPMQNPNIQTPGFYNQNQNQNPYIPIQPLQTPYAQYPQNNQSHTSNTQNNTTEGDFTYDGHTYNIHRLHQLIDARHPNSPPPSNRGANAFALPSHGAYGPHNAPPRPQPRLGPNGRPMIKL